MLNQLTQIYLPAIEQELQQTVAQTNTPGLAGLHAMMAYHMGWEGENAGAEARGKRVRPILVLLCVQAAGGQWQDALPAAAAVELIHNFSLIHDDIEDNSPLRRGRPTLWTKWGIPQALNTGDAMFTLAHLALLRLRETASASIVLEAAHLLQSTCLHLTQGQYLDISYEKRTDLTVADYWPMVAGKTAALLAACTGLGALVAQAAPALLESYRDFGRNLGLAFQALDDLLGIWGDATEIGKSTASDLLEGKKSLPVLYGLMQRGAFARRWWQGPLRAEEIPTLAAQLEAEGARAYSQAQADHYTALALQALSAARPAGEAGQALQQLANQLLQRRL